MNFLLGIIFVALGVAIIRFRYQIYTFTGEWSWANQYLGGNGTVSAIVLIGMFLIGLGTAYPFGFIDLSGNLGPVQTEPSALR